MASKPANLEFKSAALPSIWQWREDSQPEKHANVKDYLQLAKTMAQPTLAWMVDTLQKAGYGTNYDPQELVDKISKLKPGKYLKLPGVSIGFRVKSEKSANDKILMDSITEKAKLPDDIGDYIGLEAVGETVLDDIRLVDAFTSCQTMSSRKNEFAQRSAEGYPSHKSHHMLSSEGRRISVEVKVTDGTMAKKADPLTHRLMCMERAYFKWQSDAKKVFNCSPGMNNRMSIMAETFHALRVALNNDIAKQAGLDALLETGSHNGADLPTLTRKVQKRMIAILGADTFAEIKHLFANNNDQHPQRDLKIA